MAAHRAANVPAYHHRRPFRGPAPFAFKTALLLARITDQAVRARPPPRHRSHGPSSPSFVAERLSKGAPAPGQPVVVENARGPSGNNRPASSYARQARTARR